ncbi:penicillin-binding protein [Mucilaginibacter sp. PPCGB 2223]|uniref:transglycosylase domain-containing protein n=1 Tax=Mucilaginibacter sp. PPCGB 2223 TaxID=1886027 RepID=UPI000825E432|nr:biosynthetic peptidoglycan transglycosylase [Mucilaginibacter sp. PPCGB 2223]OCX50267.1 penicillin-binding protein [Mucilaginibacter sp. PPCGB 2223]
MHLPDKKYFRVGGIVLLTIVVLIVIAGTIAWFKRENLLHNAIDKATAKAKRDYNLDVKIGSAHFTGLSTVAFDDITIVPQGRDSLLDIKNFEVEVRLWPLLFGNVKLASVKLDKGWLNLTSVHGVKNFDFLFKKKRDTTENTGGDISVVANDLINQVLYKIPDALNLNDFIIKFHDDSTSVNVLAKTARIEDSDLSSTFIINNGESTLHFAGKMRPSDKYIDVRLYADNKKVELPFIEKKFGLKLSFDTIGTRLDKVERSNGETRIYSSWSVSNLLINHPRLATTDIVVPNGSIDANIFIGEHYVSIDSSSVIHLKDIVASPYVKYTLKPAKIYELKLAMPMTDAQKMFNSFPKGTFDALEGIQVSGKLAYNLSLYLDSTMPDSVRFNSELKQENFNVVKYGNTNFDKLNSPFVYTPYENGKPMPSRTIGPSNPDYTPLENISPYLQHAVMSAEDPTFYSHHGIIPEAIRKSIAIDFKKKKFNRGGSTISMQLVKNAFLSRQKTMLRKIEEMLIVWMIENKHIVSKNRMLEVYFNIIEWGNNVYGIGEASRYYFGKSPAELDLGESIYLASIVPKPKAGLYAFQPDGSLKDYLRNYFRSLGDRMANQHYINLMDSLNYGFADVRLKSSQRSHTIIAPGDTAAIMKALKQDQDDEEEDNAIPVIQPEKKPNFFQRLFGKKDTTHKKEPVIDTAGKTKKQIRQEKRAERKKEKEEKKKLMDRGLF